MIQQAPQDIAPLQPFWHLATEGMPERERFDAWHAELSAFNDIEVAPPDRPAFRASATYWSFGSLTLSVNIASPLALVRSDAMAAQGGLEHDVIVVAEAGEFLSTSCGVSHVLDRGQMLVGNWRNGYDFRTRTAAGGRWLDVTCPPEAADRLREMGSGRPRTGRIDTPCGRLLARFVTGLARQAPRLTAADGPAIEQALLSMMAAVRVEPSGGQARLSATATQAVARARVAYLVERELHSARLTVDRVSEVTRIPRTSLYRLFAGEDGVATYIRTRRLEALRDDLSDPAKRGIRIAQLAEARGFHCLSTLSRTFRDRYGCTPSDLRGRAAANADASAPQGVGAVIQVLRRQQTA